MADDQPYQVLWAPKVIEVLKGLSRKARKIGINKELAQTIRTINERLRRGPLDFGEIYWSRGSVVAHHAVCGYVSVDFKVDKQRRFVQIQECHVLSGHGL